MDSCCAAVFHNHQFSAYFIPCTAITLTKHATNLLPAIPLLTLPRLLHIDLICSSFLSQSAHRCLSMSSRLCSQVLMAIITVHILGTFLMSTAHSTGGMEASNGRLHPFSNHHTNSTFMVCRLAQPLHACRALLWHCRIRATRLITDGTIMLTLTTL